MSTYLHGCDVVVGAAASGSGRSVLITVRDVPALVRSQGGNVGRLAQNFLPDTIENTVYQKMAAEISSGMKAKGVDADVRIVNPQGFQPAPTPDFTRGALIGGAAVGLGWLATHFLTRRSR